MKLTELHTPKLLMVVYSTKNIQNGYSYASEEKVYIETAPIYKGKAGAMRPMSKKVAATLSKLFSQSASETIGGIIPRNVLYCSFTAFKPCVAWYTKPQKKRILYGKETSMPPLNIPVPGLLWIYRNSTLHLYAVKDGIKNKTEVFKAPFNNITGGSVCLGAGTNVVQKDLHSFKNFIASVELAFWGTHFGNHNDNQLLSGNLMSLQKKMHEEKATTFPLDLLAPMNKTVGELLNGLDSITEDMDFENVFENDAIEEEEEDNDE